MVADAFRKMMFGGDYREFCDKYRWDVYLSHLEAWNRSDKPRSER